MRNSTVALPHQMQAALRAGRLILYINARLAPKDSAAWKLLKALSGTGQEIFWTLESSVGWSQPADTLLNIRKIPLEHIQPPSVSKELHLDFSAIRPALETFCQQNALGPILDIGGCLFLPISEKNKLYKAALHLLRSFLEEYPSSVHVISLPEGLALEGMLDGLDPALIASFFFQHFPDFYPVVLGMKPMDQFAIAYANDIGGFGRKFIENSKRLKKTLQAMLTCIEENKASSSSSSCHPSLQYPPLPGPSNPLHTPTLPLLSDKLQAFFSKRRAVIIANAQLFPYRSEVWQLLNDLAKHTRQIFMPSEGLNWSGIVQMLLISGRKRDKIKKPDFLTWVEAPDFAPILAKLETFCQNNKLNPPINIGRCLFLHIKDHLKYVETTSHLKYLAKIHRKDFKRHLEVVPLDEGIGFELCRPALEPAWIARYIFQHFPKCYPIVLGTSKIDQIAMAYANHIGGLGLQFALNPPDRLKRDLQTMIEYAQKHQPTIKVDQLNCP